MCRYVVTMYLLSEAGVIGSGASRKGYAMVRIVSVAVITLAVCASACGGPKGEPGPPSGSHPIDMKMTMMPMPAIYGGQADKEGAPVFKGLGAHTHKITTDNPQTQAYFDQGVNLMAQGNRARHHCRW